MQGAYNCYFDIASLFVYSFILSYGLRNIRGRRLQNIIFFLMTINGIISASTDIITSYCNVRNPEPFFYATRYLWNYIYLFVHNLQPLFFMLYVLAVADKINIYNKKNILKYMIPYFITFTILLLNPITKAFYFDDTITDSMGMDILPYQHSMFMVIIYIDAVVYLILILIQMRRYAYLMNKDDRIAINFLGIGALVSVFVQLLLKDIMIEVFIQSLLFFGLFSALEERAMSYDKKTGCYLKPALLRQLEVRFKYRVPITIFSLKIEGLEYYRTFHSQERSDEIVHSFSSFLQDNFREERVYISGGKNLTVLLEARSDEEKKNLISSFNRSFSMIDKYMKNNMNISEHIKIAGTFFDCPKDADTLEDFLYLMENKYESYGVTIKQESVEERKKEIRVSKTLREGLNNNAFYIMLQPIIDKNENVISAEVLLRFKDDEEELFPAEFIPIAEKTDVIWDIGLFTIEEAAKVLSSEAGKSLKYLEVNLSPIQCLHGGCRRAFMEILDRYNVRPEQINLEITESAFIEDFETFYQECQKLKEAGFKFSVDDYGSGFSNYRYIVTVAPDIVKLDRDILIEAETNKEGRVFYESTVRTIKDMGYHIVSEGVETEEQKSFVRSLGSDYIQGFYYSKPITVKDFNVYMNDYKERKYA